MSLIVSHHFYAQLRDNPQIGDWVRPGSSIFGMRVEASSQFPFRSTCGECHGTGEGGESTYCPPCKGAGAIMVQGIMDGATLVTSPLPRKFEPRATFAVPARRLCRGLA